MLAGNFEITGGINPSQNPKRFENQQVKGQPKLIFGIKCAQVWQICLTFGELNVGGELHSAYFGANIHTIVKKQVERLEMKLRTCIYCIHKFC